MGRKSSTPLKYVVEIIQTCCSQGKLSLTEERLEMVGDRTGATDGLGHEAGQIAAMKNDTEQWWKKFCISFLMKSW